MDVPMTIHRFREAEPVEYFLGVLATAGAGDESFCRGELRHGDFSALVPRGTPEQRVLDFAQGGLLLASPPQKVGAAMVQEVPAPVSTISSLLAAKSRSLTAPVLWLHEPILHEHEVKSRNLPCQKIDGQLYLAYEEGIQMDDKISELIRSSMLSWHFLAFVTDRVHHVRTVPELVAAARMVVVGAYDGESILFWDRRGDSRR